MMHTSSKMRQIHINQLNLIKVNNSVHVGKLIKSETKMIKQ